VSSTELAESFFEALAKCDDDAVRKFCARDFGARLSGWSSEPSVTSTTGRGFHIGRG
jgi:hypothetical protein